MKFLAFNFINLMIATLSYASPYMIAGPDFVDVAGSKVEIPNMPRIRSQDHLGICHAFSAATLAQKYYCDLQKIQNCAEIPPDKEISPLSVLSFQYLDENKKKENIAINDRSLRLIGGSSFLNLWNSQDSFSFFQEACFPFDQFVEKFGQSKEMMDATISRLERFYKTNKKSTTESDAVESCPACLEEEKKLVAELFPDEKYKKKLEFGLTKSTFYEFLYETLFAAGCKKINMPSPKVNIYPEKDQESTSAELKTKIKQVLGTGVPLQIASVCSKNEATCDKHGFVLSGYKKVCKSNGECLDMVKAHNSYGKEWQIKANEGWIVFDELIKHTSNRNGPKHLDASISWLTEKK